MVQQTKISLSPLPTKKKKSWTRRILWNCVSENFLLSLRAVADGISNKWKQLLLRPMYHFASSGAQHMAFLYHDDAKNILFRTFSAKYLSGNPRRIFRLLSTLGRRKNSCEAIKEEKKDDLILVVRQTWPPNRLESTVYCSRGKQNKYCTITW